MNKDSHQNLNLKIVINQEKIHLVTKKSEQQNTF